MDDKVSSSLEAQLDHLMYNTNSLDTSSKYLGTYRQWIAETRDADAHVIRKVVAEKDYRSYPCFQMLFQLDEFCKKFGAVRPEMEKEIHEVITWLHRKIGWNPNAEIANIGYVSYEDMLLRYRGLKKQLNNMKIVNKQITTIMPRVVQEHTNMCQMNDKLDEIRYRWKLVDLASTVSSRGIHNDALNPVFSLPVLLSTIIFDDNTSQSYAATLLNICKRLLVISEAVQYERDPKNKPIVTQSGILPHPPQSEVTSLYVPIAEDNGEVLAPEDQVPLVARDSAHTLGVSENGEVTGGSEVSMPVAKDSVINADSTESLKPVTKSEKEGSSRK
uniref:DUF4485 domain-containing protein n=1 Tax=Caenorhabditis tropicalis TaxID=1561998 RepID=A0A1I7TAF0_9PELO